MRREKRPMGHGMAGGGRCVSETYEEVVKVDRQVIKL